MLYDISHGERGTKQVLLKMRELANNAMKDPLLIEFTNKLVEDLPERDKLGEAKRIFEFVRDAIRFIKDPIGLETIFSPQRILGLKKEDDDIWVFTGRMSADCDEKSTLLATMFQIIGLPTRFCAVKLPAKPKQFTHVWTEVKIGKRWYPADAIVHKEFGWSYPFIVERLYLDNMTGKLKKEKGNLGLIGEPLMVLEGFGRLFTDFDIDFNLGNFKNSLFGWLTNPLMLLGLIILGIFSINKLNK